MTAVRPPVRFGELKISPNCLIKDFKEKPQHSKNWINGGYFVMNKKIFEFIKNDNTILERFTLQTLSKKKKLFFLKHFSFWQCMDTMRDKIFLNKIWNTKKAPWKILKIFIEIKEF